MKFRERIASILSKFSPRKKDQPMTNDKKSFLHRLWRFVIGTIRWTGIVVGIIAAIILLVAFTIGIVLGILWLLWKLLIWTGVTSILATIWNHEFWTLWGFAPLFGRYIVIFAIGAAVYLLVRRLWRSRSTTTTTPKTESVAKALTKDEIQARRDWWLWPFVTVPYQHGGAIFRWWFGKGQLLRSLDVGTSGKKPLFEIAEVIPRKEEDIVIDTPQMPTGPARTGIVERARKEEESADKARARLESKRPEKPIGDTISYTIRMTASVRSGSGVSQILKAQPEYRDFKSKPLLNRFRDLISIRLKDQLVQMPFEDTFFIPSSVVLLGLPAEIVGQSGAENTALGPKRWKSYLESTEEALQIEWTPDGALPTEPKRKRNIFALDLNDPLQVLAAIAKRPESLLATFFDFGYKVTAFGISDPNPTPEVQAALKARLIAEINRDAEFTRLLSKHVDDAEAQRAARNIQAEASVYNLDLNLEGLKKMHEKHGDGEFKFSAKDLMSFNMFYEDRRSRVRMGGRLTQIDVGPDAPISSGTALIASTLGDPKPTPQSTDVKPDEGKKDKETKKNRR